MKMEQPDDRIVHTQKAIMAFLKSTADLHEKRPDQASIGSKMAAESTDFGTELPFINAVAISDLAFHFAHDHLSLFAHALTHTCDPISSCTVIRSILEFSAVGAWVTDPTISEFARVARVYAVRFEAIVEQIKCVRCVDSIEQSQLDEVITRREMLAEEAESIGILVRREKGKVLSVGTQKPGATKMIAQVLNDEFMYRLLSSVAHGQHWAVRQIGYKMVGHGVNDNSNVASFKKRDFPEMVLVIALHGMLAYSRLIWNTIGYRETDRLAFEEILETTMDRMFVENDKRFWRSE